MKRLGEKLGAALRGGEVIELVGDVGAGKTTLAKGVARGLTIDEDVQSPSFTISRVYEGRDNLTFAHYDFYRLQDAGIMGNELHETINDPQSVTLVEWADIISGILPEDRVTIFIKPLTETKRELEFKAGGKNAVQFMERLK